MKNTAIIGGGAAGLCTAVMIKTLDSGIDVTVYEAADRVCKKLSVTGNGRCNISNTGLYPERYHGDGDFAARVLAGFGYEKQKDFFEKLGIPFTLEGEKAFPMSLQASSVTDALRFAAEERGAEILLSEPVASVTYNGGKFTVSSPHDTRKFDTVVIAAGGKAGGKLSSDKGYEILKSFGHKIERLMPAIVPVKTETELVRQLKGVKVDAVVTAVSSLGTRAESGEVLFCDYGLSGPPVLQVSRLANGENAKITLDLMPNLSENSVKSEISDRFTRFSSRQNGELLSGFINKRLGQVIIKKCGIPLNGVIGELAESDAVKVAHMIKSLTLKVTDTAGFSNAQVTAGGAQCSQFFDNMMSKKVKGLFAVGEVLDVDGDCGGFNLAFAWSSAFAAANGVKELSVK